MKLDKNFYRKNDFWFGIGMSLVLLVFWSQLGRIKADTAKIMPSVIIAASWICCLFITAKAIFDTKGRKQKKISVKQAVCLLATLAFICILILNVKVIGMYLSLFLSITAISLTITYMEGNMTWKKALLAVAYDLAVIVVIYVLFAVLLNINTPKGILI